MKRKHFLRSILFGIAASFIPNILKSNQPVGVVGYDPYNNSQIGKPSWMTDEQWAHFKLQYESMRYPPQGKVIDIKFIRNIVEKLNKQNGME